MTNKQPWLTRGKLWIGFALAGAIAALAGVLVGWRPAPSGAAESPEVARQIAEFRALRDGVRKDLDSLKAELAKQAAAPPPRPEPNPPPEQKPAPPTPPSETSPEIKPSDEKPTAAAQALKAAKGALDQSDVEQAIKLLQEAAENADDSDRAKIESQLEQARRALPKSVLKDVEQSIADASNDQIERWIASGDLPPEWTKDFTDSHAAGAFRRAAVKLLPIAWHNREQPKFGQRAASTLDGSYRDAMTQMARMYIFRDLTLLRRQGQLDAAGVKQVSDNYTAYGAEGYLPAVRGMLVAGMETDAENVLRALPLAGCEDAAVRGEFDLVSCAAMLEECRLLAPEHYQPIDAPHPLAGRWRGKLQWQIHVDIPKGKVTYVRAESKSELTLSILKVGVDYLVGFAPKLYGGQGNLRSSGPSNDNPFFFEKLAPIDDVPRELAGEPFIAAGLTLFIASPTTKTMDAYRRLEPGEAFIKKIAAEKTDTWRELSDIKRYRLFERYRQATAPASR